MTPPPATEAGRERVQRFSALERSVHWCTAALVFACIATAAALSIAPVSTLVGRRDLMRQVHVACGLLLALPLLSLWVPFVRRRDPMLRADVRLLAHFDDEDMRWLRRRGGFQPGKFHPGQKLNAAATAAAIAVLYATGIVLRWFDPFPLRVREGATFVHDWAAFLFTLLVAAHVLRALADPASLRGIVTGRVDRARADHRHPRWRAPPLMPPSEASSDPIPGAPSPSGERTGPSSR